MIITCFAAAHSWKRWSSSCMMKASPPWLKGVFLLPFSLVLFSQTSSTFHFVPLKGTASWRRRHVFFLLIRRRSFPFRTVEDTSIEQRDSFRHPTSNARWSAASVNAVQGRANISLFSTRKLIESPAWFDTSSPFPPPFFSSSSSSSTPFTTPDSSSIVFPVSSSATHLPIPLLSLEREIPQSNGLLAAANDDYSAGDDDNSCTTNCKPQDGSSLLANAADLPISSGKPFREVSPTSSVGSSRPTSYDDLPIPGILDRPIHQGGQPDSGTKIRRRAVTAVYASLKHAFELIIQRTTGSEELGKVNYLPLMLELTLRAQFQKDPPRRIFGYTQQEVRLIHDMRNAVEMRARDYEMQTKKLLEEDSSTYAELNSHPEESLLSSALSLWEPTFYVSYAESSIVLGSGCCSAAAATPMKHSQAVSAATTVTGGDVPTLDVNDMTTAALPGDDAVVAGILNSVGHASVLAPGLFQSFPFEQRAESEFVAAQMRNISHPPATRDASTSTSASGRRLPNIASPVSTIGYGTLFLPPLRPSLPSLFFRIPNIEYSGKATSSSSSPSCNSCPWAVLDMSPTLRTYLSTFPSSEELLKHVPLRVSPVSMLTNAITFCMERRLHALLYELLSLAHWYDVTLEGDAVWSYIDAQLQMLPVATAEQRTSEPQRTPRDTPDTEPAGMLGSIETSRHALETRVSPASEVTDDPMLNGYSARIDAFAEDSCGKLTEAVGFSEVRLAAVTDLLVRIERLPGWWPPRKAYWPLLRWLIDPHNYWGVVTYLTNALQQSAQVRPSSSKGGVGGNNISTGSSSSQISGSYSGDKVSETTCRSANNDSSGKCLAYYDHYLAKYRGKLDLYFDVLDHSYQRGLTFSESMLTNVLLFIFESSKYLYYGQTFWRTGNSSCEATTNSRTMPCSDYSAYNCGSASEGAGSTSASKTAFTSAEGPCPAGGVRYSHPDTEKLLGFSPELALYVDRALRHPCFSHITCLSHGAASGLLTAYEDALIPLTAAPPLNCHDLHIPVEAQVARGKPSDHSFPRTVVSSGGLGPVYVSLRRASTVSGETAASLSESAPTRAACSNCGEEYTTVGLTSGERRCMITELMKLGAIHHNRELEKLKHFQDRLNSPDNTFRTESPPSPSPPSSLFHASAAPFVCGLPPFVRPSSFTLAMDGANVAHNGQLRFGVGYNLGQVELLRQLLLTEGERPLIFLPRRYCLDRLVTLDTRDHSHFQHYASCPHAYLNDYHPLPPPPPAGRDVVVGPYCYVPPVRDCVWCCGKPTLNDFDRFLIHKWISKDMCLFLTDSSSHDDFYPLLLALQRFYKEEPLGASGDDRGNLLSASPASGCTVRPLVCVVTRDTLRDHRLNAQEAALFDRFCRTQLMPFSIPSPLPPGNFVTLSLDSAGAAPWCDARSRYRERRSGYGTARPAWNRGRDRTDAPWGAEANAWQGFNSDWHPRRPGIIDPLRHPIGTPASCVSNNVYLNHSIHGNPKHQTNFKQYKGSRLSHFFANNETTMPYPPIATYNKRHSGFAAGAASTVTPPKLTQQPPYTNAWSPPSRSAHDVRNTERVHFGNAPVSNNIPDSNTANISTTTWTTPATSSTFTTDDSFTWSYSSPVEGVLFFAYRTKEAGAIAPRQFSFRATDGRSAWPPLAISTSRRRVDFTRTRVNGSRYRFPTRQRFHYTLPTEALANCTSTISYTSSNSGNAKLGSNAPPPTTPYPLFYYPWAPSLYPSSPSATSFPLHPEHLAILVRNFCQRVPRMRVAASQDTCWPAFLYARTRPRPAYSADIQLARPSAGLRFQHPGGSKSCSADNRTASDSIFVRSGISTIGMDKSDTGESPLVASSTWHFPIIEQSCKRSFGLSSFSRRAPTGAEQSVVASSSESREETEQQQEWVGETAEEEDEEREQQPEEEEEGSSSRKQLLSTEIGLSGSEAEQLVEAKAVKPLETKNWLCLQMFRSM